MRAQSQAVCARASRGQFRSRVSRGVRTAALILRYPRRAIREALGHKDIRVQLRPVEASWQPDSDPTAYIPILKKGIKAPYPSARVTAAGVVQKMGPRAKDLLPDLRAQLKEEENMYLRRAITAAVAKVKGE